MKIIMISPQYYPHIGGVEYVVKSVAERLVKRGINVTVFTGESSVASIKEEEINGVHVIRWPTFVLGGAYHVPRLIRKLISVLRELTRDADIVHVHNVHAIFSVYTSLKIRELNSDIKIIVTPHYHGGGHTIIREALWRAIWHRHVLELFKKSNRIHCVSYMEAKRILLQYPEVRDKIVTIPNGIEDDVFRYKWRGESSDYILYAGRIEKYKNLELAIDIINEMHDRIGCKELIIIGDGPYKKKLMNYVKKKSIKRVVFIKSLTREGYLKFLANAKYAINPSFREAFSIFIAEALAIGVPVILSKVIIKALNLVYNVKDKLCTYDGCLYIVDPTNLNILSWDMVVDRYINRLYKFT